LSLITLLILSTSVINFDGLDELCCLLLDILNYDRLVHWLIGNRVNSIHQSGPLCGEEIIFYVRIVQLTM